MYCFSTTRKVVGHHDSSTTGLERPFSFLDGFTSWLTVDELSPSNFSPSFNCWATLSPSLLVPSSCFKSSSNSLFQLAFVDVLVMIWKAADQVRDLPTQLYGVLGALHRLLAPPSCLPSRPASRARPPSRPPAPPRLPATPTGQTNIDSKLSSTRR